MRPRSRSIFTQIYEGIRIGGSSTGALKGRISKRNILNFVGIKPVECTLIGNVEGSAKERAKRLAEMKKFGGLDPLTGLQGGQARHTAVLLFLPSHGIALYHLLWRTVDDG